jgi:hypothetical protein
MFFAEDLTYQTIISGHILGVIKRITATGYLSRIAHITFITKFHVLYSLYVAWIFRMVA